MEQGGDKWVFRKSLFLLREGFAGESPLTHWANEIDGLPAYFVDPYLNNGKCGVGYRVSREWCELISRESYSVIEMALRKVLQSSVSRK